MLIVTAAEVMAAILMATVGCAAVLAGVLAVLAAFAVAGRA